MAFEAERQDVIARGGETVGNADRTGMGAGGREAAGDPIPGDDSVATAGGAEYESGGGPHRSGVLVVGYGNALRSDDGVGWHAARLLAADPRLRSDPGLANVEVRAEHQLAPELALDFSRVGLVVLIDADADLAAASGSISVRELAVEPLGGSTSHHVEPGMLLALARELYGRVPRAVVIRVGVETMDVGDTLSPPVAASLRAIVDAALDIIRAERA